ncbi:MAG: AsmA-like C-terminal region-containing protein [Brumimicrobium sp.]|nr:AsmA-like C-terminal region-containing protein [Brumimicrobium sp.]
MLRRKKFWKRLIGFVIIIPLFLILVLTTILYFKQDDIVQHFIQTANEDFQGKVTLKESHIAPFAKFPYISVDLENFKIFENKESDLPLVELEDVYLGFNLWTMISGDFEIKMIELDNGHISLHQYENGEFDLMNAFKTTEEIEDVEEEFHFDLKKLKLKNVRIDKTNYDSLKVDGLVKESEISFRNKEKDLFLDFNLDANMSIIQAGDTSFIKNKDFKLSAILDYQKKDEVLKLDPCTLEIMNSQFNVSGQIDIANELDLDIVVNGRKSDFGLLIALAPDDLIPLFSSFENKGDVYFKTSIQGPAANGKIPKIIADFGCANGFFKNPKTDKTLESLNFKGKFENELNGGLETMRLRLSDFSAKPETGKFSIDLSVINFAAPEIDLKLKTNFELDYLAKFLNVSDLRDLTGKVEMEMNFHDIIDLDNPEKSIEKMNESYYTRLNVEKLGFIIPGFKERFENINLKMHMDGHQALIDTFTVKVGKSDLNINGSVSDLPAILHHTSIPVKAALNIHSKEIDIHQLTGAKGDKIVNEDVKDLRLKLLFNSSAKAITESPYLPIGEFFIQDFYADLTTYPHTLHDFHADILIDSTNLSIVDFTGMIDKSDFHFSGKVEKYPLWFREKLTGDTKIEYDLTSSLLQLHDLFSYQGENHVPEDYRHEEFKDLKIHGDVVLHFENEKLKTTDIYLTEVRGKMKMHPLALKDFGGRVHIENDHLTLEKFRGTLGKSSFVTDLSYYFGDKKGLKENYLRFDSPYLDFDALFSYEMNEKKRTESKVEHDSVFSIFDIPFPKMRYHVEIGKMNYHKYKLSEIKADLRTTENHMLYIDTLQMDIAGGHMDIGGYFSASDRSKIYFSPNIAMRNIDLDKLMLKFDNFGQDEIVSENLHGRISGKLWGKVHMHADLVPIIDDSEIHMDINVLGGSLENYTPLLALSGYFEDKQLHKVIFDTLQNHIDMKNGQLTVPEMIINTNLGFLKVSGKQDMNMNMEYYISVPWKMISKAGSNKLFGSRKESDDEIGEYDPNKKYRFVNLVIRGDAENYSVSLGKKKNK